MIYMGVNEHFEPITRALSSRRVVLEQPHGGTQVETIEYSKPQSTVNRVKQSEGTTEPE